MSVTEAVSPEQRDRADAPTSRTSWSPDSWWHLPRRGRRYTPPTANRTRRSMAHVGSAGILVVLAVGLTPGPAASSASGSSSAARGGVAQDPAQHPVADCGTTWTQVPVPAVGSLEDRLTGVARVSPTEAWAVGQSLDPPPDGALLGGTSALVYRGDGARWSPVSVPAVEGAVASSLDGVAATSESEAWAVGWTGTPAPDPWAPLVERPRALRWDGSTWVDVAVPGAGPHGNGRLTGVTAVAADDVWAVGSYSPDLDGGEARQPLVVHWDGERWDVVPSATHDDRYPLSVLEAVDASAPDDVWAVGSATQDGVVFETVVQRWDGRSWTVVDSPSPRRAAQESFGSVLYDVMARGPRDVVAVGLTGVRPYIIRYDGRRWQESAVRAQDTAGLQAVSPRSDGALVGVGNLIDTATHEGRALAVDIGRKVTVAATEPVAGSFDTRLLDVDATGVRQLAVGSAVRAGEDGSGWAQPLIQQRCTP